VQLVILLTCLSIFIVYYIHLWKQNRNTETFFNKKAFIISVFVFLFLFISSMNNDSYIMMAFICFFISFVSYLFFILFFDDPKYPDGNRAFEYDVRIVRDIENAGKIMFPYTMEMYKRAKYRMEQHMVKNGIVDVRIEGSILNRVMHLNFESPEAKAKYFKNVPGFQLTAGTEKQAKKKDDWLL